MQKKSLEELNRLSGPELEAHIRAEFDAMSPQQIDARMREVFDETHARHKKLLAEVNRLLGFTDTGFESLRDTLLEPGQRLELLQRVSRWVEVLIEGLGDEPGSCPPVCPYQAFLDELERLRERVREQRLRDRIDSIGGARAMDDLENDLLYEQACRAIDVQELSQAYGWEPPEPVLELLFEASVAALAKAG